VIFINYLSRVHFGFGVLDRLAGELAAQGIGRPLLVSDPGVRRAGLVDRVLAAMGKPGAQIFDGTPSNPTEDAVLAALEIYRAGDCDGVVALGGGSAIDLGKAVALLASHGGALGDYEIQAGGGERIGPVAPIIALPTTAGTGAEVGRAAAITFRGGHKSACVSPHLIPAAVICDPELTMSLPPAMTAATGMDALTHGIETFVSNRDNPPAGAIALDCVNRASRFIERAVAAATDGESGDREARSGMLMAALEGGLALQKGLGAVHAMSHVLEEFDLHHGTLNAVLLPAVLRFNQSHCGDEYVRLRQAAGLAEGADLADWIEGLNARIGLPTGLAAMGVSADHFPRVAAAAAKTHLGATNPRPAAAADYQAMLAESMG
jgi:alcohol dehydrogenase class IV